MDVLNIGTLNFIPFTVARTHATEAAWWSQETIDGQRLIKWEKLL
jgi:hypothetical protein